MGTRNGMLGEHGEQEGIVSIERNRIEVMSQCYFLLGVIFTWI